ncbi:hypothetical protein PR003_g16617 [Phytophthora rubi]|uniref:Uncharacterized protein n=2 Tax=Phytophthora rubi TaxID=129364 RepID=A0A6A4EN45_9STRA|nr:hypothetical protein PR003_g16617 [Phytophthora rubi]
MFAVEPSDAQGGRGQANPGESAGEQAASLNRAEDAAAQDVRSPTNYAAAVNRGRQAIQCAESTPPTNVAGSWKPREQHDLLATLAKDWHSTSEPVDTPEQATLRKVAVAPSEVHADTALRQKTATELEVLLDYLSGSLELPHPPNFAKAVLPLLQRAMLEQYHETHHEEMLTADVTPRAQLRKSMTHNTRIGLLFNANTDTDCGRRMRGRLMDDVKRLHFDGIHTLHFVFNSQRIAQIYAGTAFRLNGTWIVLEDSTSEAEEGVYKQATLRRKYAVRIYGADTIGLVVLLATLCQLPVVKVVDAERPRVDTTDIVDNRYFLLRFDTASCPEMLRGITKLSINGQMITLHHHVVFQRVPCARCYTPYHTVGFCKIKPAMLTKTHAKFRRTYKRPVPPYAVGTATQYRHTDSDSLTIFLATLHRELAQSVAPSSTASTIPEPAVLVDERVRPPTVEVAGAQEVMAVEPAPGPQPTDDAETTPPSDGFTVVTRRAGRGQSRGPATTPLPQEGGRQIAAGDTPLANQRGGQSAATSQGAARSTKPQRQGGHQPLSTPRKSKEISKKARKYVSVLAAGFDKFKRDRAMGSFTALEDSYDDPEMEGSDHDDEEAPYAYVARPSAPMNVSGMDA